MPRMYLDHTGWERCRHYWSSAREFLGSNWSDGLHSIAVDKLPIDLLVTRADLLADGQRVLPVIFSGSASRAQHGAPFFFQPEASQETRVATLCISDPSLALYPELEVGWYAGSRFQATQRHLTALLEGVADRWGVELLLVGGDGGGFAALWYAAQLGERCSVVVWNPDTDLLRASERLVHSYLREALRMPVRPVPSHDEIRAALTIASIEHSVLPGYCEGRAPRRVLYLQDLDDQDRMHHHLAPFVSAIAAERVALGRYQDAGGRILLCFGNWSESGHPLPERLLEPLLHDMLDPDMSLMMLGEQVSNIGVEGLSAPLRDPLIFADCSAHLQLQISCDLTQTCLRLHARLNAVESSKARFAFYVFSGDKRIQMRWYEDAGVAEFPILPGQPPTRAVAFAMDSLGEKITVARAIQVSPDNDRDDLHRRIFVLGSCVSRDAFAAINTPFTVVQYVARSSLASALHPKPAPREVVSRLSRIDSPWQRRMVEADAGKRLPSLLTHSEYDLLLLDLVDERFRLAIVEGAPVTVSSELLRSGFVLRATQVLAIDEERRMQLWREGVERFLGLVDCRRVVLNRVYWATHSSLGAQLEDQAEIARQNAALGRMYEYLLDCHRFATIDYPPELLVADENHRWGLSPFHFVPDMYAHTMNCLLAHADGRRNYRRQCQ